MMALYRLGDGCTILHGYAFAGMVESADTALPIVVNIGNFQYDGGFRFGSTRIQRYSGAYPERFDLSSGDLLLVMTCQTPAGEILGVPARIPEDGRRYLHNQRLGRVRVDRHDELDIGYLYYLFLSRSFNAHLVATATGAKILHTAPGRIESYRWSRPPIAEQRRIAAVLSAYDGLVENNLSRIGILEEMARAIYQEWFVDFRFPGATGLASQESMPSGWTRVPIGEVYDGLFDGPHATPPVAIEGPVFLGIGNITESGRLDLSSVRHIDEDDLSAWTKRVSPRRGDIVFTYEATLNRYAMIPRSFRGCLGRRVALIRLDPARRCGHYLFLSFFSEDWRRVVARNTLTGSTVDRIPLTTFPTFPINLPPLDVLAAFDDIVGPMFDRMEVLDEKIRLLRVTRDLLLPRLISGELDVSRVPDPASL
jgi:type I restriction enzyme S subunit